MDADRKKQLQERYKNYRPAMGVFGIRRLDTGKTYLMATNNLKGKMNSVAFQLRNHSFITCHALNDDYRQAGEDGFVLEILEELAYDKDDEAGAKDYSEELDMMKTLWQEKLVSQGIEVY